MAACVLPHPNVVSFIGACWGQSLVASVTEWVGSGVSLADFLCAATLSDQTVSAAAAKAVKLLGVTPSGTSGGAARRSSTAARESSVVHSGMRSSGAPCEASQRRSSAMAGGSPVGDGGVGGTGGVSGLLGGLLGGGGGGGGGGSRRAGSSWARADLRWDEPLLRIALDVARGVAHFHSHAHLFPDDDVDQGNGVNDGGGGGGEVKSLSPSGAPFSSVGNTPSGGARGSLSGGGRGRADSAGRRSVATTPSSCPLGAPGGRRRNGLRFVHGGLLPNRVLLTDSCRAKVAGCGRPGGCAGYGSSGAGSPSRLL